MTIFHVQSVSHIRCNLKVPLFTQYLVAYTFPFLLFLLTLLLSSYVLYWMILNIPVVAVAQEVEQVIY